MSNTIRTTNKTILATFAVVSLLVLASCSSIRSGSNELKTKMVKPLPDTAFIEHPERQSKRADLPFQKVWIAPGFVKSAYKELLVAPVNTQYMFDMDWLHQISSANWVSNVKEDIKELGKYFHDRVVQEFRQDLKHRFKVIERPEQYQFLYSSFHSENMGGGDVVRTNNNPSKWAPIPPDSIVKGLWKFACGK